MFNHLMIDLETPDLVPSSKILAIGAVYFDIETGETGDELSIILDSNLGLNFYRTESVDTLAWWQEQDPELVKKMFSGTTFLEQGLVELAEFYNPKVKVWSNGSIFDIAILENAYRQCEQAVPWKFWDILDVRTIVYTALNLVGKPKKPINAHDPIIDCKYQITYVSAMYNKLRN